MHTYELLDRFEMLYPTNSKLADLRRAYIDQDLSSIFRLTNTSDELRKAVMEQNLHSVFRIIDNHDTEELRKAVMEKNLHSVFRLVTDDDLRKLVLEDNTWKLWPVLARYSDSHLVAAFKSFFVNPALEIDNNCFSRGQLQSKQWLIKILKELDVELGTVFLCAGWYAILSTLLFESGLNITKIRSFDVDSSCEKIAEIFNKPWLVDQWKFKAITQDIMDIDYSNHSSKSWSNSNKKMCYILDSPDTVVNTSCEHIGNFEEWYAKIPKGKLVILQSNNYFEISEHINCSADMDSFGETAPMQECLFLGELQLPKYTRFMKIGYR